MDDIAGHQFGGVDDLLLAVARDARMRRGQIFQCVQRLFRLALLQHAHNGVEHDDQQDEHRLKELCGIVARAGNAEGNRRGSQQDDNHHILELIEKTLQICLFLRFFQPVFPVFDPRGVRLFGRQPLNRIGSIGSDQILGRGLMRCHKITSLYAFIFMFQA